MTSAVATKWAIDPTHSEIHFKVRHMMVSNVTGSFTDFSGTVESEREDFTDADIRFTADINSISTNNEQRDAHLKSEDFFHAAAYPELTFRSTSFRRQSEGEYILKGEMTIRDQTHPLSLRVLYNGSVVDAYGQTKAGFEISGKISRKAFGLQWNAVTEAGNVVVSDEVRLDLNVQLVQQA